MGDLAEKIAPHLGPDASVTDAGSAKAGVVHLLEGILGDRFVGSHPMAGSEKNGIEAAQEDLFEGAVSIITPTARTRPSAMEAVRTLWHAAGCRLVELSPELHDECIARVSHLPHAIAALLVNVVSQRHPRATALAGGGYRDTTRIAGGPPAMWTEIFLENKAGLIAGLEDFTAVIEELKQMLISDDASGIEALLTRAKETRARLS